MTTIQTNNNVATVIEVFSIEPDNQQTLLDSLKIDLQEQLKQQPGFIFASLHKSIDRLKVANYMQWTHPEAYEIALKNTQENKRELLLESDCNTYNVFFTAGRSTEIKANDNLITLINVFTVEPQHQQAWAEQLAYEIDPNMRQEPGYLSTNFHLSLDGTKIINYSQWENIDKYEAAGTKLQKVVRPTQEFQSLVLKVEPHLYQVEYTIDF